jgi:hypothetical protein
MRLRETVVRWLRGTRPNVSRCPACENLLPPNSSFCPHCFMVLRPEGMAELHHTLQGAKIREDIYILRKLHRGGEEDMAPSTAAPGPPPEPSPRRPPDSPTRPLRGTEPPAPMSGDTTRVSARAAEPRTSGSTPQGLLAYTFATLPSAGPEDLPGLIRWFLSHDPLIPNNLDILQEAYQSLSGVQAGWTYEGHLARTIADDLRIYDSPDLLPEHLGLLTTAYARTLHAIRTRASKRPALRSPAELPDAERHEMWELCFTLGLTATRLRVEGWIYQQRHGAPPTVEKVVSKRRTGTRAGVRRSS